MRGLWFTMLAVPPVVAVAVGIVRRSVLAGFVTIGICVVALGILSMLLLMAEVVRQGVNRGDGGD